MADQIGRSCGMKSKKAETCRTGHCAASPDRKKKTHEKSSRSWKDRRDEERRTVCHSRFGFDMSPPSAEHCSNVTRGWFTSHEKELAATWSTWKYMKIQYMRFCYSFRGDAVEERFGDADDKNVTWYHVRYPVLLLRKSFCRFSFLLSVRSSVNEFSLPVCAEKEVGGPKKDHLNGHTSAAA